MIPSTATAVCIGEVGHEMTDCSKTLTHLLVSGSELTLADLVVRSGLDESTVKTCLRELRNEGIVSASVKPIMVTVYCMGKVGP